MLATALTDGLVISAFGIFLGAAVATTAWFMRQMFRISSSLDRVDERTLDHDRRLEALEADRPPWEVRRGR